MIIIKKISCLLLLFTLILAACNSGGINISQTFDIPDEVRNAINTDYKLQLIKKDTDAYIIFNSPETLTLTEYEVSDGVLNINLNTEIQENTELKQYTFKMNPANTKIEVLVNKKVTPIDNIIDL